MSWSEDRVTARAHSTIYAGMASNAVGAELIQIEPEPWMRDALCAQVDAETWFPEKGQSTAPAKRVCMGCEVREKCLNYALEHGERFGVWGGLSERERRRLDKPVPVKGDRPERNCTECGATFTPNYGSTRLCSDECRAERKRRNA